MKNMITTPDQEAYKVTEHTPAHEQHFYEWEEAVKHYLELNPDKETAKHQIKYRGYTVTKGARRVTIFCKQYWTKPNIMLELQAIDRLIDGE